MFVEWLKFLISSGGIGIIAFLIHQILFQHNQENSTLNNSATKKKAPPNLKPNQTLQKEQNSSSSSPQQFKRIVKKVQEKKKLSTSSSTPPSSSSSSLTHHRESSDAWSEGMENVVQEIGRTLSSLTPRDHSSSSPVKASSIATQKSPSFKEQSKSQSNHNFKASSYQEKEIKKDKFEYGDDQRTNAILEIQKTEESYVKSLEIVVSEFAEPIRSKQFLTDEEWRKVFSNIRIILSLNSEILQEINNLLKETNSIASVKIGKLFKEKAESFMLYTSYITDYYESRILFKKKVNENPKLNDFIRNTQKNLRNRGYRTSELASLLITPIQRLPRYELLLRELIKSTNSNHPDYPYLNQAYESIKEISQKVNEKKRQRESITRVSEIAEEYNFKDLIKPSRKLILETSLQKIRLNEKGLKPCKFYLFNDSVFVTKNSTMSIRKIFMPFEPDLRLHVCKLRPTSVYKHAFAIISDEYTMKLECKTDNDCDKLASVVSQQIEESLSRFKP